MQQQRKAGVLMPISSLPSPYGIGTLGKEAFCFIDKLKKAGVKIWQVLPLLPTGYGDSPYQSFASNALNYYFIDFRILKEQKLLKKSDYESVDFGSDHRRVDYEKLFYEKVPVLKKAFARFDRTDKKWKAFLKKGDYADFALFMSLKVKFGYKDWTKWDEPYRQYDEKTAKKFIKDNRDEFEFWQFTQYLFLEQWNALKSYANENGVLIMGDMPIYVSADSVEMWKDKNELFLLDEKGNPAFVAGVPPDAFSADGQLWGNPVYDWEKMRSDGYAWWKARIDYAFSLFDLVRIDHFRGFDRFYAIPYGSDTAKIGEWLDGPKGALFEDRKNLGVVAEDLGTIDEGVRTLMRETGFPGMKVMLFGFNGDPTSEHKPSNFTENCFAYTGTHDNPTTVGYLEELDEEGKALVRRELKQECEKLGVVYGGDGEKEQCSTAVELVFASKAISAIAPYQDILCIGKEGRINFPSTVSLKNWSYRFLKEELSSPCWAWLKSLIKKYDR